MESYFKKILACVVPHRVNFAVVSCQVTACLEKEFDLWWLTSLGGLCIGHGGFPYPTSMHY